MKECSQPVSRWRRSSAYDDELRRGGPLSRRGLQMLDEAATVRMGDGKVIVTTGLCGDEEQLGGILPRSPRSRRRHRPHVKHRREVRPFEIRRPTRRTTNCSRLATTRPASKASRGITTRSAAAGPSMSFEPQKHNARRLLHRLVRTSCSGWKTHSNHARRPESSPMVMGRRQNRRRGPMCGTNSAELNRRRGPAGGLADHHRDPEVAAYGTEPSFLQVSLM